VRGIDQLLSEVRVAPDVWSHGSDAAGAAEDVLVGVDQLHTLFPSRPSNGSGADGYWVGREGVGVARIGMRIRELEQISGAIVVNGGDGGNG
jgi:hypothetical protein